VGDCARRICQTHLGVGFPVLAGEAFEVLTFGHGNSIYWKYAALPESTPLLNSDGFFRGSPGPGPAYV